jgi:hypothetical protein
MIKRSGEENWGKQEGKSSNSKFEVLGGEHPEF